MNKKILAAVSSAALVLGATSAQAGVIIPAGEWTVDINGNVNAYVIHSDNDAVAAIPGAMANAPGAGAEEKGMSINTGLLPSWLGVTATTRQNDLDVSWTISFQPGASSNNAISAGGGSENRQAFLTFGDKSWGSVKMGKDLGIFGSTAILNDMTLLGVGSQGIVGTAGGTTTTLGGIGTGYVYADWKGQVAYTSPNMNGFSFTAGVVHPWHATTAGTAGTTSATSSGNKNYLGFEGQLSFAFESGKIWAGFASQDVDNLSGGGNDDEVTAFEAGANINFGNLGATVYAYSGEGLGTTGFARDGFDTTGEARDSDGGYAQVTYVIPSGTKLGVAYGVSNLDATSADRTNSVSLAEENKRLTVGAYHPLTKHLNLVAEYSSVESQSMLSTDSDNESDILSVGAILFF